MSVEYERYLDKHISGVVNAYDWMCDHSVVVDSDHLREQISQHDKSKWDKEEYDAYDTYFNKYDKDNRPQSVVDDFNAAFLHHIHNNPHHWQYWVLIQDSDENNTEELIWIPENYIIEMICDWWSFSWNRYWESHDIEDLYSIFDWYNDNRDGIRMNENSRNLLEEILADLYQAISEDSSLTII